MNAYGNVEVTDRMLFTQQGAENEIYTLAMDDIEEMMVYHDRANANVPHTPESTNMALAGLLKKEYALRRIFSEDIKNAHLCGDLHLHNLDMIDRPYCSGHSPAYVAKYGLSLPGQNAAARPAKYADVLLEQLIKFAAGMQGHFSGAIGFDAFNMFLSPYVVGMDDKKLKQLAQIIVFEFSQQAVARGGQTIFSDLNLYWDIPKHYREVMAVGPGGKETGLAYKEYGEESKAFMKALMEVYLEGDGSGRPFFFPKADCHITAESVDNDEYMELLGRVASVRGSPYFIFDRGNDPSVSQCCRLKVAMSKNDIDELKEPWRVRFSAIQNITMNLPGIVYRNKGNETKLFEELGHNMELAGKAHDQKMAFIERLVAMGTAGPLAMLSMDHDGMPYMRYDKCKFLIGMVGLNEAVQMLTGEELHQSRESLKCGMKIIAYMNHKCKEIADEIGFNVILEQTPAESTAYRFAKLDCKRYGEGVHKYINGDFSKNEIYYTNSTQLKTSASMSPIERVKIEGKFHPMIDAGSMTHIWLGETQPSAESIAAFVRKTYNSTENAQITFSPEFTSCMDCKQTSRGLGERCGICGSEHVLNITRVTGFFSVIQSWNAGKRAELRDRARVVI